MEFGVLGPLRVLDGGVEVDIRRGSSRTLLIALILRARETVPASALMELLWGDDQPRNPANALQIQISHLRKSLSSTSPTGSQPIVTRPGGYTLDVEPDAIDAARFERRVAAFVPIDRLQSDAAVGAELGDVDETLALWRGDALCDVAGEPFVHGTVTRLDELRCAAQERRIDLLLAAGRHREAIGALGDLIAAQPLHERFHEQVVLALYRCGRQADALRAYEVARVTLLDELGLDPGPALKVLEQQILNQDPALDWHALGTGAVTIDPVPSATWRRNFVPAPLTALIGRDADIARIREVLSKSRLVTLTGPAGAGKTRLAIDIATQQSASGPVWYVDMSSIDLPELVASAVAGALGATTGPGEDAADVVASALAAEAGLLVLDTCEHVVAGASRLVSAVLHRSPAMRVLATSRRPLAVAGEVAWPVPPLRVAPTDTGTPEEVGAFPAVALFCERARAVRPDFELTAANSRDVAEVCVALDGLPLAIELAAARADVLSPRAISERLQNRFELLVEGAADVSARQQTLRGAIDWSVDLLTDAERCFFARLGAFAGSFDLAAAGAVAGDGSQDPLALLTALVRHSMVTSDDGDRFRLLDTLRAYASELLAGLDADETRRRHARHYTEVAEHAESLVRGEAQRDALARLRADVPNFRAALEWSLGMGDLDLAVRLAGSLAWFWALDGRLDVADRHLRRAIAITDVPAASRAKVLWGYALLVAALGNLDEALEAAEASTALARQSGDDAAIGCGLNAAAVARWALGDLDAAVAAHEEAIERFASAGDLWGEAICRVLRARTAVDRGDPDAEERIRIGLDTARRCGDAHVVGIALSLLAQLQSVRGNHDAAVTSAQESLRLQESIGYTEGTVAALHLLARLHLEAGEMPEAKDVLLRGLELAWKMQHAAATCEAVETLARIAFDEGDEATAAALLTTSAAERAARNVPLRPVDRPTIEKVEAHLRAAGRTEQSPRPMADVVAELVR